MSEPDMALDDMLDLEPSTGSSSSGDEKDKRSVAAVLVDMALDRYEFGVTDTGDPYARPMPGGHVVRPLRGGRTSLRHELSLAYRKKTDKVATQAALADAMSVLHGDAQDTDPAEVNLRVAQHDGVVYLDQGDAEEHVIRLDRDGWDVVNRDVPVLFRRTNLTGVFPTPERGGDLDALWSLLNVKASDRPLFLAWLVAALVDPGIPHPVLALMGEQGTGKSSATRMAATLVDPSPAPLRKPPKDADGWMTAAAASWVVALDNLSTMPDWLSDTICKAVTGDGDVRRALYTDDGVVAFSFRRVILFNGIDLGSLRSDLADRLIVVELDRIPEDERRTERQLTADWDEALPGIFGALLDQCVAVLRERSGTRLERSPRMADFALILATLDRINGTDALADYMGQADNMAADAIDSDPFLAAVKADGREWDEVKAVDLFREFVEPKQSASGRVPGGWPKDARHVTSLLKRRAPALRKQGWEVTKGEDRNHTVVWTVVPPQDEEHPTGGEGQDEKHPSDVEGSKTTPATPATPAPGRSPAETAKKSAGDSAGVDPVRVSLSPAVPATPAGHPHPETDVFPGEKSNAGNAGVAGDISRPSTSEECPEHGPMYFPGHCAQCETAA
ncbi:hypothetical protein [Brevibacterium litoralis]|uniref:hypothetical protein n=1 Tax=Brevibacterium litoralis TaxID=3138935 RepID=UPI0032EFC271